MSVEANEAAHPASDPHRLSDLDSEQPEPHCGGITQARQAANRDLEGCLDQVFGIGIVDRHRPSCGQKNRPMGIELRGGRRQSFASFLHHPDRRDSSGSSKRVHILKRHPEADSGEASPRRPCTFARFATVGEGSRGYPWRRPADDHGAR